MARAAENCQIQHLYHFMTNAYVFKCLYPLCAPPLRVLLASARSCAIIFYALNLLHRNLRLHVIDTDSSGLLQTSKRCIDK